MPTKCHEGALQRQMFKHIKFEKLQGIKRSHARVFNHRIYHLSNSSQCWNPNHVTVQNAFMHMNSYVAGDVSVEISKAIQCSKGQMQSKPSN